MLHAPGPSNFFSGNAFPPQTSLYPFRFASPADSQSHHGFIPGKEMTVAQSKNNSGSTSARQRTCKERIGENLKDTIRTLGKLWKAYQQGREKADCEDGTFLEYGLCFDYVVPEEGRVGREPYFRYQLSWGGPSDEFRFFATFDGRRWRPHRIEYWFLDWFDGARRVLRGKNSELLEDIFAWFDECGSTQSAYRQMAED